MEFTEEAIEFMRSNDGFVQDYHNYCKEDRHLKSFREMVQERIRLGEIIQKENNVYSSDSVLVSSNRQENIHDNNFFQMNRTLFENTMVPTNINGTSYCAQANSEIVPESSTDDILPNPQVRTIRQETIEVNCQQQHTTDNNNNKVQKRSIQILSNLTEDSFPRIQLSPSHDNSYFYRTILPMDH
ncbi:unnamed protein product [Didymodactylos carnosus]|uniref:Uncharacterized protein n=1 Tax=Didymodactylos carnosus TaxID=1234261 RepID=A0A815XTD5_9BILA|nr:unnamed protein product [Didymodactylos carnosus]CAF4423758.1 unnamed protein product [Didymodactylos carnosus]